jgi:uncharacterized hydrophobic protein (TIGR00271 family)
MSDTTAAPPQEQDKGKSRLLDKREQLRLLAALRRSWRERIVDSVDQVAVLDKLDDESAMSPRYVFMTLMSAAIAVLGLLQSSPAVVIGAMLLSPLMGPIIGAGFALVVGNALELRACARTLVYGTLLAIGISALIVFLSPIQTVTPEIAARTRPNLFDLLIALFSALAGAYAVIRGRGETIVGVAIATALMPPLAVIGFGLATLNWTVFGGALLLFITNLMTIALSAAVMARFYGFSTALTKKQTRMQVLGIVAAFVILAVPLGISLSRIAWETNATRQAQSAIRTIFPPKARISQIELESSNGISRVRASVLTPRFVANADELATRRVSATLDQPIDVVIDQYRVGTDPGAAEEAELAAASAQKEAEASQRRIESLIDKLALVTGADPSEILLDRVRRRASVRARPIPGADLATYRELERRVADDVPGWQVTIGPPALPLPTVEVNSDEEPDAAALDLLAWAIPRVGAPVELTGSRAATTAVRDALAEHGIDQVVIGDGAGNSVSARWTAPDRIRAR